MTEPTELPNHRQFASMLADQATVETAKRVADTVNSEGFSGATMANLERAIDLLDSCSFAMFNHNHTLELKGAPRD